jgi:hypothetical protein
MGLCTSAASEGMRVMDYGKVRERGFQPMQERIAQKAPR